MASSTFNGNSPHVRERVLRILRAELRTCPTVLQVGTREVFGFPTEFLASDLSFDPGERQNDHAIAYNEDSRASRAKSWYQGHVDAIRIQTDDYIEKLDEHHSHLITCNFRLEEREDDLITRVCHLLSRLPATSSELGGGWDNKLSSIPRHLFQRHDESDTAWDRLAVTNFMATNTIRLAIQMELGKSAFWGWIFRNYINTLAELLEAALTLAGYDGQETTEQRIVQVFLWTCWQRATMLHLTYLLRGHLEVGYDFSRNEAISLKVPRILQQIQQSAVVEIPQYMCKWAFESIRSDRASVALDFRVMMMRFEQLFGNKPSRCVSPDLGHGNRWKQCSGQSPGTCHRFVGREIQNQSVHTVACSNNCSRLFWNEKSYRSSAIAGARAVCISRSNGSLNYCAASDNTLAISHVWSHGQGGRPELPEAPKDGKQKYLYSGCRKPVYGTGLNQCLHQRYCNIAGMLKCDSYWMDTPCIPQDHKLRREAIMNINSVFADSKHTLVCDADLMEINISDLTMKIMESILASLLVCDWNVRAWTLLESMRGRNSILILCKDDQFVPLRHIISKVHKEGSIALISLFATAQHMLPAQAASSESAQCLMLENRAKGFVSVQEAACLLSHRHASRPNDEVIIWSLLCGDKAQETPIHFWKQKIGNVVPTGLLVSSIPRISPTMKWSHRGFGWAPSRPNMPTVGPSSFRKTYFADDGARSEFGFVTKRGIKAQWLVAHISGGFLSGLPSVFGALSSQPVTSQDDAINRISFSFLKVYIYGALLQVKQEMADRHVYSRDGTDGTLLVVVGSQDRRYWHWRGLYEWDSTIPLPEFATQSIHLV